MSSPVNRLEVLVDTGQLRFIYVLGLARSGSTIACRLLGEQLDGAVYEPATPAALDRRGHYARVILKAYAQARKRIGNGRPVTLAIKDLSLFLDDPEFEALVARAAHVVFTVREPASQQASLTRQLGQEFAILQRIDAIVRHPFEAAAMAWFFLVYGSRFIREARTTLGEPRASLPRLAIAGWNLVSYRNMDAQMAALGPDRFTLLDADALRRDPAAGEALLASIAATIAPAGPIAGVEIAGHSRMLPRSKWAAEALASHGITPSAAARKPAAAPDAFERTLLDVTGDAYRRLWARRPSYEQAAQ